jgi:NAD-dependent dihydropyrimidine dehydrogenase PreA subunit
MALFIDVEVVPSVASNGELVKKLVEVCPVNIFAQDAGAGLQIVEKNLDECTLCELCLNVAPAGTVIVKRLYGKREPLARRA